jgi:hypothetical protein
LDSENKVREDISFERGSETTSRVSQSSWIHGMKVENTKWYMEGTEKLPVVARMPAI